MLCLCPIRTECGPETAQKRSYRAFFFFFQAEDGIRDFCLSRGLGDVYKRQVQYQVHSIISGNSVPGLAENA